MHRASTQRQCVDAGGGVFMK